MFGFEKQFKFLANLKITVTIVDDRAVTQFDRLTCKAEKVTAETKTRHRDRSVRKLSNGLYDVRAWQRCAPEREGEEVS